MTQVIQKNWQRADQAEKLQVSPGSDPRRLATVVAEPLERGFRPRRSAMRFGVSFCPRSRARRDSVHIDGVLHEFSSIRRA